MRSAGIIMDHYGFMYKHTPFLIKIVKFVLTLVVHTMFLALYFVPHSEQTTPKLQDSAVELLMSYWKYV
jgi:hypothetical protein